MVHHIGFYGKYENYRNRNNMYLCGRFKHNNDKKFNKRGHSTNEIPQMSDIYAAKYEVSQYIMNNIVKMTYIFQELAAFLKRICHSR